MEAGDCIWVDAGGKTWGRTVEPARPRLVHAFRDRHAPRLEVAVGPADIVRAVKWRRTLSLLVYLKET